MNKRRITIVILSVIIAFMVVFIFANSLKSREESKNDSDLVAGIIGPVLEWIFGGEIENIGFIVRKMAHFTEFCMLGLATSGLIAVIGGGREWGICGYGLLFCLLIAVCDEFIQSFVGRGSAVSDVLIDFGGAVFGFVAIIVTLMIIKFAKNKKFTIQKEEKQ